MSHARTVEISWAGRVRTGNKKVFEYAKDIDTIFRLEQEFLRWIEKNWNKNQYQAIFISANTNSKPVTKNNIPPVAIVPKLTTSKENAQKKRT